MDDISFSNNRQLEDRFFRSPLLTLVPYGTSKDLKFDLIDYQVMAIVAMQLQAVIAVTAPKANVILFKCSQNESDY